MMYKLLFFVTFISICYISAYAQTENLANFSLRNTSLSLNKSVNLKIVGGRRASRHEFPYQAALIVSKPDTAEPYLCGGTLINPVWVLTSAFCVSNANYLAIFVGIWNISKITDVHDNTTFFTFTERTIVHPCYEPNGFTGVNLGLAKLLEPATGITPACLPTSFHNDWYRLERGEYLRSCVATGFGTTDVSSNGSEVLQKVRFSNVSTTKCNEAYRDEVSFDKICAFGNYHQDTCGGDAGGPLMCRSSVGGTCSESYLAGVTLAGSSVCGDNRFPGMYTAVFPHVDWINLVMREEPSNTPGRGPTTNPGGCSNLIVQPKMNQDGSENSEGTGE